MTWSCIHKTYLVAGTVGNCSQGGCHSQMGTPSSAYSWLKGQGYIGTPPSLTGAGSCLIWYGTGFLANMPPGGSKSNPKAKADMDAWAAAGAQNN
jgi:hypothetical protein